MQKQKGKKGAKKTTTGDAGKDEAGVDKSTGDDKPAVVTTGPEKPGPESTSTNDQDEQEKNIKESEEKKEEKEEKEGGENAKEDESLSPERMPDAPTSPDQDANSSDTKELPTRGTHHRQPSLSVQSKMRSSSFRNSISTAVSPGSSIKSPPLLPLTPGDEQIHEVFKKQATRLDELEKENKRLEKDLNNANARREKIEDELEDLRESSVEVIELKDRLARAEKQVNELETLVRNIVCVS